ncbi:MAG: hypothetical protein K9W46_12130 [Candidatus Heimdallarchaeum endolithica]|uniref:DUF4145 domain-containing protein n=1 Tax=Candidatus Heimdallarchaeum endolithica TaxID=2876572 RepID=A0A9Y1FNX5_9ARCH|nr:MAG: hypothetical protein K9W46_12130 [Candidatus Heimdallarchaeum endolithica]
MQEELVKLGNELLEKHKKLEGKLREIPYKREMRVNFNKENSLCIAKPRFTEPKYSWPKTLLGLLLNHLQEIWDFLQKYHYYFDEKVISFIHKDYRRSRKDSIIFLLERDVWETDEVYGNYLVERKKDKIIVSYYRREERRKTYELDLMPKEELEKWIMDDAKNQIISTFDYKWGLLETEIDTCANGLHIREITEPLNHEDLISQTKKIDELLKVDTIASMLSLGRVSELWCIHLLNQKKKEINQNLIQDLVQRKIIDKHQERLLNQIRIQYNSTKHKLDFRLKKKEVVSLYKDFCELIDLVEL